MFIIENRIVTILTILSVSSVCRGRCLQNTFVDARVRVCGSTCLSQILIRDCIGPDSVPQDTREVTITSNVTKWRNGAIHDLPNLEHIVALTNDILKLYPGVFLNLPKLKTVELTFNDIDEIMWGVFSNTSTEDIDLSWNQISFVENEAFSNMPNLQRLNLNRNKISDIYQSWFTNSYNLETLILSYNELEKIHFLTFDHFPNLTYLDLSFNKIKEIGAGAFKGIKYLKLLDLTSNKLSWIQPGVFETAITVEVLRLPLNRLSFLSTRLLDNGNVRGLYLHPNPWQCPCLETVYEWIRTHNSTLIDPDEDHRIRYDRSLPECSVNPKSRDKCVIGYDDAFLAAQEIFFKHVNYSASLYEKPTTWRPNFHVLQLAPTFSSDLSPLN